MFSCKICNIELETVSALANHARWNHQRDKTKRICELCNKHIYAPNFHQHIKICGVAIKFIWCNTCGKSTTNLQYCSKRCSAIQNNTNGSIGYTVYRNKRNIKKKRSYRDICFERWDHKCIICGWNISVDVHHIDENHSNNTQSNLVPLCQNHHTMTRMIEYKEELKRKILDIVNNMGLCVPAAKTSA